jgi:uncharacterized protein YecT (DUF1311 family)
LKLTSLLTLGFLVLVHEPAHALDCTKASLPVDKLICTTPDLKRADEEMGAAYFKLLRATTDPDFHEALIRSQRRWLEVRSHSPDRFGLGEQDKTDDREVLLKMTRERLSFIQTDAPIHLLELQRKIASEDRGGAFAGYRTWCVLQPPPYGNWDYECRGDTLRQRNDRICSSVMEWASGHVTERRAVSVLENGEPKVVATCSTGYASTNKQCPEPDADVWAKLDAHWNTTPDPSEPLPTSHVTDLWKFDPDIDPTTSDQAWMHDCLFSAAYPPRDAIRPGSKGGAAGR